MERGSYTAASGGVFQLRRLEVVANNLANVNTSGFKRQVIVGQEQTFDQTLASQMKINDPYARGDHERTPGITNIEVKTDFSLGPVKFTGNELNAALREPNDFFVINTPDGQAYTRAGEFTLNSEGALVTSDGMEVQGDGGAITANAANVKINPDGSVEAGGTIVGQLQVVRFENPQSLERVEGSRFRLASGSPAPEAVAPDLVPQSVEMANVSAISSMIELINANRAFEMYTKSALTIDAMDTAAINQVGRPR